jgi:hypothetical protein
VFLYALLLSLGWHLLHDIAIFALLQPPKPRLNPFMRRSSPVASATGGDDTDLRSKLFALNRKTVPASSFGAAISEAPYPLVSPDSRALPSTLNNSTCPVAKPVAKPQALPLIDGDLNVTTVSPLAADASGFLSSTGVSLESLQEELNRRKTHNVSVCDQSWLMLQ